MNTEPLTESYYFILLCLYKKPHHGYGIMQDTLDLTNGRVKIGSGTMYGAISNMLKKKWIVETYSENSEDNRKRLYQITGNGRLILEQELDRLKDLINCSEKMMNGGM